MKTKITLPLFIIGLCASAAIAFGADNPHMGTWKLDEAKSKIADGAGKNNNVVYEASGDSVKVTIDGTDKDGKALHSEWTGKFDGKDYAVTGDPTSDMRSAKKTGKRSISFVAKKDGKAIASGTIVVAADGKSRTVVSNYMMDGKKAKSVAVYEKQ